MLELPYRFETFIMFPVTFWYNLNSEVCLYCESLMNALAFKPASIVFTVEIEPKNYKFKFQMSL